ncbi:hypothetical protein EON65_17670 [archaeon]|nr:MAG: hypothetical protein EON65_17670 [archaeon]
MLVIVFALLVIFYCSAQPNIPKSELNALQDLYTTTNGEFWSWVQPNGTDIHGVPWNFSQPSPNPCYEDWQGVDCGNCTVSSCHVEALSLKQHNITGNLQPSLSNLTHLHSLMLQDNFILGRIPSNYAQLQNLESLDLRDNRLSGPLPSWLPQLKSLAFVNLSRNFFRDYIPNSYYSMINLTTLGLANNLIYGSISDSGLAQLVNLQVLNLGSNLLNGTIPKSIGLLPNLSSVLLLYNLFTGTLPVEITESRSLIELTVFRNSLNGTIPAAFGSMTQLQSLILGANAFSQTVPYEVGNLVSLRTLNVAGNVLTGTFPDWVCKLSNLTDIQFYDNVFESTLPSCFRNLTNLEQVVLGTNLLSQSVANMFEDMPYLFYLDLAHNLFTGSLPVGDWEVLYFYQTSHNLFRGSIPDELALFDRLNYCVVDVNMLTGTLPEEFGNYNNLLLNIFAVNNNFLHGSIPSSLGNLRLLVELFMENNFLSSTVPSAMGNMSLLVFLDLTNNMLTGALPLALGNLTNLDVLFVSGNRFSNGNLDDLITFDHFPFLTNVDISHNRFTGSLPMSPFQIPTLRTIDASVNCFEGTLSEGLCQPGNLSVLILDGLSTSLACRSRIFPKSFSMLKAFTLNKIKVSGSIPSCVFNIPGLRVLHLSGNYLTNTLPHNLSLASGFTDFMASHNLLSGTIPLSLQHHSMREFRLSYNRFGGTLTSDFVTDEDEEVHLEVNRLSGIVPTALRSAHQINMLDGNIFGCSFQKNELPKHDPKRDTYICGSDEVDSSLYAWLGLCGLLLIACIVALVDTVCRRQVRFRHVILHCKEVWQASMAILRIPDDNTTINGERVYSPIFRLTLFYNAIRRLVLIIAAYSLFVLMPMYIGLSQYSKTYEFEFGWEISSVLLAGRTAAIMLFVGYCVLMLIQYLGMHWVSNTLSSYGLPNKPVLVNSAAGSAQELARADTQEGIGAISAEGAVPPPQDSGIPSRVLVRLGILFSLNLVIMILTDVAYVYIVLNKKNAVVVIAQILLATFKLFWNEVALWFLVPFTKINWFSLVCHYSKQSHAEEKFGENMVQLADLNSFGNSTQQIRPMLRGRHSNSPVPEALSDMSFDSVQSFASTLSQQFKSKTFHTHSDVNFITVTILLNNILVPAIAIAYMSSTCFYNAIVAFPSVTDEYSILQCALYFVNFRGTVCAHYDVFLQQVSYDPPYIYSYNCASTIILNFSSVFIYMFIAAGLLLPAAKLGVHTYYHSLPHNHQNKVLLARYLPEAFLFPHSSTRYNEHLRLFRKEKSVVKLVNYLAIMLAFGSIYPPIVFLGTVAIFIVTYLDEYILGYMLQQAQQCGFAWYRFRLNQQCQDIHRIWIDTARRIIFFAYFVLGYVIFDTFGYNSGWKRAIILLAVFFALPIIGFVIYLHMSRKSVYLFFSLKVDVAGSDSEEISKQSAVVRDRDTVESQVAGSAGSCRTSRREGKQESMEEIENPLRQSVPIVS